MTRKPKASPRHAKREHLSESGFKLSSFARGLLKEWRGLGLPLAEATVVVAVSGGADSVALLLGLDQLVRAGKLSIRLVIAHFNHQLRGDESDADARWVQSLAKQLGRPAVVGTAQVSRRAAKSRDNLEQAARLARYDFLEKTAKSVKASIITTAHTMDDQAETVLLNLLRGSGAEGLGGMKAVRPIKSGSKLALARPLLAWARRADTERFCRECAIEYRVDQMNADESFARVRVRRQLLPLMQTFNPNLVETLTRTSDILREDSQTLDSAATRLLELSAGSNGAAKSLRIDLLLLAAPSLRRRALRLWLTQVRGDLRRLDRAHILAIEKLVKSEKSGRLIELPGGSAIVRAGGQLHYRTRNKVGAK